MPRSRLGTAPKEQPPRKLSGKRTAGGWRSGERAFATRGVVGRPTEGVGRSSLADGAAPNLSGLGQRGLNRRRRGVGSPRRSRRERSPQLRLRSPSKTHAALRSARRPRRQDGRVRRLDAARAVPGRDHGRAPSLPERRGAVRRFAHGPGPGSGTRRGRGLRAPGAGRRAGSRRGAASATRSSPTMPAACSTI